MMKKHLTVAIILTLLIFSRLVMADGNARELQASTRINDLSTALLQLGLGREGLKNTMVSSVSLFYALSILEAGATGETKALLRTLLLKDTGTDAGVADIAVPLASALAREEQEQASSTGRFVLSNSIWATNGDSNGRPFVFSARFAQHVATSFGAGANAIDFLEPGSSDHVNQWAKQHTHELIDDIIDDGTLADLTWLIVNAVYFQGGWATPMRRTTASDDYRFTTADGDEFEAETITSTQLLRVIDNDDGSIVLAIPFSGGQYHMVIQLPEAGELDVENWLRTIALPQQADAIKKILSNQSKHYEVRLRMPVFSFGDRLMLDHDTPATRKLGLLPLFTNEAEFPLMVDRQRSHPVTRNTKVGIIQQDTRIELDENGVKAAAVTMIGGVIKPTMAHRLPNRRIVIDRPFAWCIVEGQSQTVLFSGVLANPSSATR